MSKTVKRVSKTVKSVMTVMMVGLIAMLGAKAEAHWVVVKGRCFWHSGECVRQDKEPAPDPVPILLPPIGEVVVTPKQVEILCDGIVQKLDLSSEQWTLATRRPIVGSDITRVTNPRGKVSRNGEWAVIVSDAHFLEDPDSIFCPKSTPKDVIIREMAVKMNLYCSRLTDKACFSKPDEPHSSWEAKTCTLPVGFNLEKYPENLPPRGTPFACSNITTCHGDC